MNRSDANRHAGERHAAHPAATVVLGLALLIPGVILLLDNLGLVNAAGLLPYWPLILVTVGVSFLVRPAASRCVASGVLLVASGVLLLLGNLSVVAVGLHDLWPLLLVAAGAAMLTRWRQRDRLTRCWRRHSDSWPAA